MKKIKITCKGQKYTPIDQLKNFQGELKKIDKNELKKLKRSIIKSGFSFPVLVWRNYILDGHQRIYATKELLKKDYTIGDIPVVEISAKDRKEAAEKLLLINSHYASMTHSGLEEYINTFDLDFKALAVDLTLPDVDMDFLLSAEELEKPPETKILHTGALKDLAPSKEESEILEGKKILIEYSGGKDSSAVAVWAKHFYPDAEIELVYCEMGADFVGFNVYLNMISSHWNLHLKTLRSQKGMIEEFIANGKWPHFSHPYCHNVLHSTLDYYYTQFQPKEIVIMRGGRAQERSAQSGHLQESRFLKINDKPEYIFFQPLYFAAKDTADNILNDAGSPVWDGYSYGLQRTACRCCPGQRPVAYAAIRENFPSVWDELISLEKILGKFAWGKHTKGRHWSFAEMAALGEKRFNEGGYKHKFTRYL